MTVAHRYPCNSLVTRSDADCSCGAITRTHETKSHGIPTCEHGTDGCSGRGDKHACFPGPAHAPGHE